MPIKCSSVTLAHLIDRSVTLSLVRTAARCAHLISGRAPRPDVSVSHAKCVADNACVAALVKWLSSNYAKWIMGWRGAAGRGGDADARRVAWRWQGGQVPRKLLKLQFGGKFKNSNTTSGPADGARFPCLLSRFVCKLSEALKDDGSVSCRAWSLSGLPVLPGKYSVGK